MPFKRIGATDPITGHDIEDLTGKPHVVGRSQTEDPVIYFEFGESVRQNPDFPVEQPIVHHLKLEIRWLS